MDDDYATAVRDKYLVQSGSEQIASLISIQTLISLLQSKRPDEVLELGAGIGTLTQVILEKSKARLTSVENNEWCQNKLEANMNNLRTFSLMSDYLFIDQGTTSDFVVIDANIGIFNSQKLIQHSPKLRTIFIEGHHLQHRINASKSIYAIRRTQKLIDVRISRGSKGCAYFEIEPDSSKLGWKSKLDFIRTHIPLLVSKALVKLRRKIARILDSGERFHLISNLRKIWKGKIPWSF